MLAADSRVSTILVYQWSRFMRNAMQAHVHKDRLRRAGVRVVAVQQETSDDPMGRMIETIFEGVDPYESEIKGIRTRGAMRTNAERGWFNGSRAPFGYRVAKTTDANGVAKGRWSRSRLKRACSARCSISTSAGSVRRPSRASSIAVG